MIISSDPLKVFAATSKKILIKKCVVAFYLYFKISADESEVKIV